MAYLAELHYCHCCGVDLGPDNGDGICAACDMAEDETETDEAIPLSPPPRCPRCQARMRQMGLEAFQCTRPTCLRRWEAREEAP